MPSLYVVSEYTDSDYVQEGLYINWGRKVIFIPKSEMLLVQSLPIEIRQLDLNEFRLWLKDLEDGSDGINFLDTHRHNPTVSVSGAILARVVEIINGYTVTFEDGQYAVNLVGSNSNVADVTNVNQVSVRSANSAGLQDLNSLQAASYVGGSIAYDGYSIYSGTNFPLGIRAFPINNMNDCLSIATARGLKNISVLSNSILSDVDLSDKYSVFGDSMFTLLHVDHSVHTGESEFNALSISGYFDNGAFIRECIVYEIDLNDGSMYQCAVLGPIRPGGVTQCTILDCYAGYPSEAQPVTLDLSNAPNGFALTIRAWHGDLRIINCSSVVLADIGIVAGHLYFDSTVTDGYFSVFNQAVIENYSTGSAVIMDHTIYSHMPASVWNSNTTSATVPGSIGEKIRKNLLR